MIKRDTVEYRVALECYKKGITPSQAKDVFNDISNDIVQQLSDFYVAEAAYEEFKKYIESFL